MAFWNRSKPYFVDKPIVAFTTGVEAPFSVTLQALDFGLNYTDFPDEPSKKSYPGGHFIVRETQTTSSGISTYYRFLPAAKITAVQLAVEGTTGKVTFTVERAYPFTSYRDANKNFSVVKFDGGGLAAVYTYHSSLTLESIDYTNKKIKFTDVNYSSTSSSTSGIASFLSATYSSATYPSGSVSSVSNHYLIRSDYLRPIVQRPLPDPAPTEAGVPEIYYQMELVTSSILGIHEHSLDFTDVPTIDVAVISKAAGVYANNLPYSDPQLLYAFQHSLNPRTSF